MRILALAPLVPDSPVDGDRLRIFHFLRELGKRHEIVLCCFSDPERPQDMDERALKSFCAEIHRIPLPRRLQWLNAGMRAASALPANVTAFDSPEMRALLDSLLASRGFDSVYCYRLRMAPYALRARLPRVLDYTDSLTRYMERKAAMQKGLKRGISLREAGRLAAFETWCAWQFSAGLMNSSQDAETLRAMAPGARVLTAANGVEAPQGAAGRKHPQRISFVGQLGYAPNEDALFWFIKEVFPLIRARRPKAEFCVIGGGASPRLLQLAKEPGVAFSGMQPEFRSLLRDSALSVCPVRLAAGRQNKILDAFAAGVPVVSTPLCAEGCEAKDGVELLSAASAADFAAQCLRVMKNPGLGRRLAAGGKKLVQEKYSWSKNARVLESALKGGL